MFTSIVQEFKKLLSSENLTKEIKKFDELIIQFNQLKNESTGEEDVNQLLSNDLINALKKKLSDEKELVKKAAEKVKEQKIALTQQLEELVANEQNIGKAFKDLKSIRSEWTKLNESVGFTQKDVDNLKVIYHLVKERGFTLEGAKKKLRENKGDTIQNEEIVERLKDIRSFLVDLRDNL